MKNVIIVTIPNLIDSGVRCEAWSSLTALCKVYVLPYHTLKKLDFPFEFEGYKFEKLRINR